MFYRRAIVPTLTSLAVHAALLFLIFTVTLTVTSVARSSSRPPGRFIATITLKDTQPSEPVELPERRFVSTGVQTPFDPPPPSVRRPRSELGRIARPITGVELRRTPREESQGAFDSLRSSERALGRSATFAGMRANAVSSVVYVVDISGSMVNSLSFVMDELRRSVSRLAPNQRFQIVLFQNKPEQEPAATIPERSGLVNATARERERVSLWLDTVYAGGRSNPLDGLRRALEFEPDAVFLLARSIKRTGSNAQWGRGKDAILSELDRLNPADKTGRRPVVIKTIQFLDQDPSGIMQAIGRAHADPEDPQSHSVLTVDDLVARTRNAMNAGQQAPEIDQAAALLADLASDGADTAVLFGIPFEEQKFRVARAALQSVALLGRADLAEALEDETSRNVRLTFLHGRALLLQAALAPDESTRVAHASDAADLLETLVIDDAPMLEAARRVSLAGAMWFRDAPGDRTLAHALFDRVTRTTLDDADTDPFTTAEAWFGLLHTAPDAEQLAETIARLDQARAEPWFADDPALTIATADAIARACVRFPGADAALQRRGFARLIALLDDESLGLDTHTRRSLVFHRIAELADENTPFEHVQPEIAFARAASLVPEYEQHARAISLFDIAARSDSRFASDALWEAAALLVEAEAYDSNLEASRRLYRLAQREPSTPRGLDAATAALDLARAYEDEPAARSHYVEALGYALDTFDTLPGRDAWLLECARLKLSDNQTAEALDRLAQIRPNTPEGITARAIYVEAASSRLDRLRIEAAPSPEPSNETTREMVSIARRALTFTQSRNLPDASRFRADLADALADAADPESADHYRVLLANDARVPGGEIRLLIGAARAERLADADLASFEHARRVIAAFEHADPKPPEFWHAWSISLEILADRGSGSDTVRAHAARLRALDPTLGGEAWASRIGAAERRAK